MGRAAGWGLGRERGSMEHAHRGAASRRRRQEARDGYERVESLDYDEGEGEARAAALGEATDADDPHRRRRDTLLNAAVRWLLCLLTGERPSRASPRGRGGVLDSVCCGWRWRGFRDGRERQAAVLEACC